MTAKAVEQSETSVDFGTQMYNVPILEARLKADGFVTKTSIPPPGPRGPQGIAGIGATTKYVAGETVGSPRLLVLNGSQAFLFDPTMEANTDRVCGVSLHSAVGGALVETAMQGLLESVGAFVPGTTYYGRASGLLSATPPATGVVIRVGYALTADVLEVWISQPLITI